MKIASEKFLPLFAENRRPLLSNGEYGDFDRFTRQIVDGKGIPVPHHLVSDPGHLRTRYYVFYGGRGAAKSHQLAAAAIIRALREKTKFLCCREIMSTIADSVMSLLKIKIEAMGVQQHFDILTNEIRCKLTGSSFSFRGLRHNINELKSFEDADVCWVEEAADVTEDSWDKLDPTIRKAGSEIWVGFNTELTTDPTYVRFVENRDEDMTVIKVGYEDNPLLDVMVLKQALKMKRVNPTKYDHIWGGNPRRTQEGGIFTPQMIEIVDVVPAGTTWCRGWDLAGTAIDPKKPDKDPDWTRGVKLGRTPAGRFIIADIVGVQDKPEVVEKLLGTTMKNDGGAVEQSIPQDPGQAGKFQVRYYAKVFAGHRLHFSLETGSKATRAGPFAAQVNAGNVDMLRAPWNRECLDEMEAFTGEDGVGHDDIVDSAARAFSRLLAPRSHQLLRVRGL